MAFLLGTRGGEKICRYERFIRGPNLETILAYEAIFGKPGSALFAGLYKQMERELAERVKVLVHRTKREKPGSRNTRKLQVLEAILARQTK